MVGRIPAQLHVWAVAPGLQPRLRNLQRGLLVPQRLPEPGSHVLLSEDNCAARCDDPPDGRDVLLLVVYLLHRLGEVGLQLVVRVRGLLRTVVRTSDIRQ